MTFQRHDKKSLKCDKDLSAIKVGDLIVEYCEASVLKKGKVAYVNVFSERILKVIKIHKSYILAIGHIVRDEYNPIDKHKYSIKTCIKFGTNHSIYPCFAKIATALDIERVEHTSRCDKFRYTRWHELSFTQTRLIQCIIDGKEVAQVISPLSEVIE